MRPYPLMMSAYSCSVGSLLALAISLPVAEAAIADGGAVVCWGGDPNTVCDVPAGTFSQISAGGQSLGLRTDGTIACWGGSTNPGGACDIPAGIFMQVAAGGGHGVALRADGTLACWGDNEWGQCDAPQGTFTHIEAGFEHNLALRTDGTIACWGRNSWGQCNPPAGTFIDIAVGYYHSAAIRVDGTIACWGDNSEAQCDDVPTGVFTQISAGEWGTVALRSDGTIVCWGYDPYYGQCDDTPPGTFTQVSVFFNHIVALRPDGTVACWGVIGGDECDDIPEGPFSQLAAGGSHTLALEAPATGACCLGVAGACCELLTEAECAALDGAYFEGSTGCDDPSIDMNRDGVPDSCGCCPEDYDFPAWNGSSIVLRNNCYNYGTNRPTGTFAQPGVASGHFDLCSDPPTPTLEVVRAAAIADGLCPVEDPSECVDPTCLVALVIAPGPPVNTRGDYHWYRQNVDGTWSHKPGGTPATNLDSDGRVILDPYTAARKFNWADGSTEPGYTVWGGYFYVSNAVEVDGCPPPPGLMRATINFFAGLVDLGWNFSELDDVELIQGMIGAGAPTDPVGHGGTLGYRGIAIESDGSGQGFPEFIRVLDGVIEVVNDENIEYRTDPLGLEDYLIARAIEEGFGEFFVPQCLADLDGSGDVGVLDLLELLGAWGANPGHPADLDNDGQVGALDLLALLGAWGKC